MNLELHYKCIFNKIDQICIVTQKNSLEDSQFGEAFTKSFNYKLSSDLFNKWHDFSFCSLENYLSVVEKNRNRYIKKHKDASLFLCFLILKNVVLISRNTNDLRYMNIGLKILEKIRLIKSESKSLQSQNEFLMGKMKDICKEMVKFSEVFCSSGYNSGRCFTSRILEKPNELKLEKLGGSDLIDTKVVVFSPNPYSLYTLSVLELLKLSGFQVEAVIVRKLFSIKRIKQEFSRDGKRLINKIIRKLIFKDSRRNADNARNLSDVINELDLKYKSVNQFCKAYGISLIKCETINDEAVISKLSDISPDYGLFTGGGIVSYEVIKQFKIGILNCHAGILPHYRGMDVIEWPTVLGDSGNTGATVHFMSEGIDEGGTLYGYRMEKKLNILSARMELESYAPYMQVKSLIDHVNNKVVSQKQSINDGLNYYVMHPWLFEQAVIKSNRL